jgi:hypothetical protein
MAKVKKSTKSEQEILARNAESNRKWLEGNKKSNRSKHAFGFFPMKSLSKKEQEKEF